MTRHRLRQGNLMGPSGFLGLEDNEAMKFVQQGVKHSQADDASYVGLGGAEEGTAHPHHHRGGDPLDVSPLIASHGALRC